jgi:single-stranded DNA-binding protein
MSASVNRCTLLGQIGRYGVSVTTTERGAQCASFSLVLSEADKDGKAHVTLVPVEVWGRKVPEVSGLVAGQLICVDGKLRSRKVGEQWELCVASWDATVVEPHGGATLTGNPN